MQTAMVDASRERAADGERDRLGRDPLVPLVTLQRGQGLRIPQPIAVEALGQDDGGRVHGTGQRSPARLVGPGDQREAFGPKAAFELVDVPYNP